MSIIPMRLRRILLYSLLGYVSSSLAQSKFQNVDQLISKAEKVGNTNDALMLARKAYTTSLNLKYQKGMLSGLTVMAGKMMDSGNLNAALKFIDSAEVIAKQMKSSSVLSHLNTMKGYCYTKIGFFSEGKKALLLAKIYTSKVTDVDERHYRLGNIYTTLGVNYEDSGVFKDSSFFFNMVAYEELKKIDKDSRFKAGLGLAANNLGATYAYFDDFYLASRFINEAIKIGVENENKALLTLAYISMGKMLVRKADYPIAIDYFNKGMSNAEDLNNSYFMRDAYEGLGNSYASMKNQDSAILFLNKYKIISDSLVRAEKSSIRSSMRSMMNIKQKQHDLRMIIFVLLLVVLLFLFIIAVNRYVTLSNKYKKEQLDKTDLERSLNEKINILIEQSRLKKSDSEELKFITHLAMSNDPCFFLKFKEFDSIFIKKLLELSPKLVAAELELCALMRLSFETKEIARYTRQSVRAVESKKFRIRKKLNIVSELDLSVWMSTI